MDSEYQQLLTEAKEYTQLRYKLLKLEFLEKGSQILGLIVFVIVLTVLVLGATVYFSLAAIYALKHVLGGLTLGFCLFGGLYIIIAVVLYLLRKPLIINPLITQLSAILYEEDDIETENMKTTNEESVRNES